MKKYKLIKEYPGSWYKDTIFEINDSNDKVLVNGVTVSISANQIINYPEYYQKVIEKDYEILSLSLMRSDKHQIVNMIDNSQCYIESLLKCHGNSIHSIKRLSDGEIFTIGDNVIFSAKSGSVLKGPVIQFRIDTEFGIIVDYRDNSKGIGQHWNYLNNAEKSKKPLFTTEDGVDIFEGDKYWWLRKEDYIDPKESIAIKPYILFPNVHFSTKEAAEEYILMNKPLYSLNDVNSTYGKATPLNSPLHKRLINNLKNLNK